MSSTDLIIGVPNKLGAISSSLGGAFEPADLEGQLTLEFLMLGSSDLRSMTEDAVSRAYGGNVEFSWVPSGSRDRISDARGRNQRSRGTLYVYAQDDEGSVMDATVTFAETFVVLRTRGSLERAYVNLPSAVSVALGLKA